MNKELKEQINALITDYLDRLSHLNEYIHSSENKTIEKDMPLEIIQSLFDEISSDLVSFDIPDLYENVLSGLINSFNIHNLPQTIEDYKKDQFRFSIGSTIKSIQDSISGFEDRANSYYFFRSIGFASKNVVVVGANGSGKSTLACNIKNTLQRQDGLVIPAQKMIVLPTLTYIPSLSSIKNTFERTQKTIFDSKVTYQLNNNGDIPYNVVQQQTSHIKDLFIMLSAERANANARCGNKTRNGEQPTIEDASSTIDTVIGIWNELVDHRKLVCNDNNEMVIRYNEKEYPAYQMSDGERLILYLVAEVNLAPKNALIVVDEPELHLHKAILDKLWNRLEALRPDCLFFYLTHDLQFAASRNAIKCWIKSYDPDRRNKWEIKRVDDNELPQELLLKLLGNRKRVLFCEGGYDSIDYQLYTLLFPKFMIMPVESCKNVINYTRAFNQIKDKYAEAYGLIDRDFKEQKELDALKKDNILSYNVAEVENVLLVDDLLTGMKEQFESDADIEELKQKIIDKLSSDKQFQAARYVEHRIIYHLSRINGLKGHSIEDVKNNFNNETSKIKAEEWYNEQVKFLEDIVNRKDYNETLRIFNNKGLVGIVEKELLIGHYQDRVLKRMTKTGVPQAIKGLFPKELM